MRAIKTMMTAFLSALAVAGSAAAALPMPYDSPRVASLDGKTRYAVYEVTLSRMDKAGAPRADVQHVTLATSMNVPARTASLTQTPYVCVDDEGTHLTSCKVQSGTVISVTPRPAGAVTPRVVAAVTLDITELLALKDGQSAVGPVQYPAVSVMRTTQDIALTPGESLHLVSGPYLLDVQLTSVQ
jgi:hypothetical protein